MHFYNENKFISFCRLIFGKVAFILLLIISLVIISLEARLFGVGRSVFGLFCIVTLFIACVLAYFLLVVDSIKRTYKLHYELLKQPQMTSSVSGVTNRCFEEDFDDVDKETTVRRPRQHRRHVHYDQEHTEHERRREPRRDNQQHHEPRQRKDRQGHQPQDQHRQDHQPQDQRRQDHQRRQDKQRQDRQRLDPKPQDQCRRQREPETIALQEFSNRSKPPPKRGAQILDASKL